LTSFDIVEAGIPSGESVNAAERARPLAHGANE
jgi:hypothetical protein